MEMWDEVFSSEGAQNIDKSGYQVSDLEDIEFHGEDFDLHMVAVSQLNIKTTFSRCNFQQVRDGVNG